MSAQETIDQAKVDTAQADRGLPPRAFDFLGREVRVGDRIVYPVSTQSQAHTVLGEVLEVRQGKNRWKRAVPVLRVRSLKDSRSRAGRSARPINLTNVHRCVVVP